MSSRAGVEPPAADARDQGPSAGPAGTAADPRRAVGPLVVAVIVAVAWWTVLVTMAVTTSRPVVVNLVQIEQSPLVVTATVLDSNAGRVRVDRVWKGRVESEELRIAELAASGVRDGGAYVVPLNRDLRGRYVVTQPVLGTVRTPSGRERPRIGPPTIYPATEETHRRVEALLRNGPSR